jgi:hypothetical protein
MNRVDDPIESREMIEWPKVQFCVYWPSVNAMRGV